MNYLTQLLIKIAFNINKLIPSGVLRKVVYYTLVITGYRKQVINNNFKNTDVSTYSSQSFKSFYKANIKYIARLITESISSSSPIITSKVQYQGLKKLEEECRQNNGLILLASHYGNWELACTLLAAQTNINCVGVYKPIKNKVLDYEVKKMRSSHGLQLIPMNKIARVIAKNVANNQPSIYILIADQNPNSINNTIWTNFVGIDTAYNNGPQKLYNKYGFGISYMQVNPGQKIFEYQITFANNIPTGINGEKIIPEYSHLLENQIKSAPAYWLWSHKRWKRSFQYA